VKCSVCAQDIPGDSYSEHLESEHGVTDDPTAVLIQHLTGLHSTPGDNDADDGDDVLPDDEPSDADAFEEFLAAHPVRAPAAEDADDAAGSSAAAEPAADETPAEEPAADEPAREEPVAGADEGEAAEDEKKEPEPEEEPQTAGDSSEDEAEALTDEDEAEFERMLAVYPEVDLRKGKPEASTEPEKTATETAAAGAAAGAAGAAAAGAAAGAGADRDEKTFAVWDEARATTPDEVGDDGVLVVAPSPEAEKARRRRQLAMVGLGAAIILVAIAVIYLLTRNTSTKNTTATAPVTTPVTTVAPTFLPGPPGGATTTVITQPPVATTTPTTAAPPATTAVPATTAPPNVDPKTQISFPQMQGVCNSGQLTVAGHTTNNNAQAYTYSFTVTFANSGGGVLGTANGTVTGVPAHSTVPFNASGSCTDVNGAASHNVQITSITPA
jgi:hypothetical protein